MARTVAVLGGGVAGLSAAHELVERGFDVRVYEAGELFGGKARSFGVPGSGSGGRADLPAEHGFRFFPGFYRHLPDTMRRIPYPGRVDGVAGNLVDATRALLAQAGGRNELVGVVHAPGSLEDISAVSRFLLGWATQVGIPAHEHALFMERLLTLLTSCDERRLEQWERQSWWDFSGAERRSEAYGKFLADGLTRTLVAARAREMSARTGGLILLQLLFDLTRAGGRADRVLDAPTQEAWIAPWVEHLRRHGVQLHAGASVAGIDFAGGRIAGATVGRAGGAVERVQA
ncbi:MAG TPA: NAD(P)-binding protein, partial [Solirubrobacteraceae bacterium]|nr:NAD(P)-binding protein [Solirubrobacteraceae bacterium]